VGHIDLLDTISYFEVPEKDARKVSLQLTGIRFKGRQVRCNDAEETAPRPQAKAPHRQQPKDDWRSLMKKGPRELKGEVPDFSEEGWARRRPKKK
jgi:ATP-dependent RNA helicase DeaD